MAVRIQLRRDTSTNWSTNNPILRPGEVGIETDTLKFKIGPAVVAPAIGTAWNSITSYANVTPSGLSNSLNEYILSANQGTAGGPAELDSNGDLIIPENSIILWNDADYTYTTTVTATEPTADRTITIPNASGTVALTSDLVTTNVTEGTNLYFTDERAQDAVAAALAAGTHTNITVSYNDNANSISLTGATTYSNEDAVDAVAAALAAGTHTNISVSYDDNGNAISLTGAVTYTDENAQDAVGNAVGNGLDYDDNTGAISVDPSEFALSAVGAPTADVSMASYKITNLATPTSANDAANKAYVDNTTAGLNFHAAVHAATTANLDAAYDNGTSGVGATLTSAVNIALVVDGHTLNVGERVLVKNQTTGFQNGIYVVTATGDGSNPWVLTRATDADNNPTGEIAYGDFTFVQNGTTNAGFGFIVNTTGTITIGTTAISYVQFNAGQTVIAGNGLTESSPGTLAIDTTITANLSEAQTLTNKTISGASNTLTVRLANDVTGTLPIANGGTGITSYTAGDLIYADASNALVKRAIGAEGYLLTSVNGLPTWAAAPISLPSQTGNSGKYLTTDGSSASWATITIPSAATTTTRGTVFGSTPTNFGDPVRYGYNAAPNATGSSNMAFGNQAGLSLSTGSSNILIGLSAGMSINTGAQNTIIGSSAASNNNLSETTAMGISAMQNSSGQGSTAFGAFAGVYATTGSYNTLIGYSVANALRTGSNNIIIGSLADSSSASVSNEITLGDSQITRFRIPGLGIDWTTAPIIRSTTTITANTATTVDTNALNAFVSAEYLLSLKQGSKIRTSKVIVQTDGTNVDMTEFAITETGGTMSGVVVSATASGGNALLQVTVTDAATTNVSVRISEIRL